MLWSRNVHLVQQRLDVFPHVAGLKKRAKTRVRWAVAAETEIRRKENETKTSRIKGN